MKMFGNFSVFQGSNTGATGSGPTPYPANKAETSSPSSIVLKENAGTTIPASKGDEQGTLKGMVSQTSMQKTDFITVTGPTRIGNRTPTPDAVEESHMPKGILAEEKTVRKDLATNHDKVELHDENKRQREKVYVERQEIFGGTVGRMTDGRSTPTPTDGTTDSTGPRQSTGTGGVDLESKHRKGDPGDGDEA